MPTPDTAPNPGQDRVTDSAATPIIVCGPPKGCTCPDVAWYCICDASKEREPGDDV